MTLVWASQCFIIEGYEKVERRSKFGKWTECVKKPILHLKK